MGYNTEFQGQLYFIDDITGSELNILKQYLEADCREHPEWKAPTDLAYIDLELNDDFSGLKWTGAEKTYGMSEAINFIIKRMKLFNPAFGLKGKFTAQGEDMDDRYEITIVNNRAIKKNLVVVGEIMECPHCGGKINLTVKEK